MSRSRIVIIGAGEAGARAALTLRAEGYAGALTLIGEERHAPYERPPLSKAAITQEHEPELPGIADAGGLAAQDVDLRLSTGVQSIDTAARALSLASGERIAYDQLLLTTGAVPRKLAIPGGEHALLLRNYEDALALRALFKRKSAVLIIGGGFIGLELAASAAQLGCAVRVIEAAPRILMRGVPEPIAAILAARHAKAGVDIRAGAPLSAIERTPTSFIVHLGNGERLAADCVIAGIGAAPQTRLAGEAGLAIDNGVAVDAKLRTSDPHIWAAGDCASFPHALYDGRRIRLEAWRNALDQGAFAARSLLGAQEPYAAPPWFWSDQYDLSLQIAGLADFGQRSVARDLGEGALMLFHLAADGRLAAASAVGPLGKVGKEIRVAELLIAKRAAPDPAALASPNLKLKGLLAG